MEKIIVLIIIIQWHLHNKIYYKYLGQNQTDHLTIIKQEKHKTIDVFHPDPNVEHDANSGTCNLLYMYT